MMQFLVLCAAHKLEKASHKPFISVITVTVITGSSSRKLSEKSFGAETHAACERRRREISMVINQSRQVMKLSNPKKEGTYLLKFLMGKNWTEEQITRLFSGRGQIRQIKLLAKIRSVK